MTEPDAIDQIRDAAADHEPERDRKQRMADIVGTAIAWDVLGITDAMASPVPTGNGFIEIAHGRCAALPRGDRQLLVGVPTIPSTVQAELTTPTGAGILAALCSGYGPAPGLRIAKIG